jgi:hypothetical protein
VVAGRGGKLNDVQRDPPYGALAECVHPGDVRTSAVNRSQDLWDLLIAVVPELNYRGRHRRCPCLTDKCHERLRKDNRNVIRREFFLRGGGVFKLYVTALKTLSLFYLIF